MKQHSLLALLAAGLIFGGCAIPGQSNSGWHPQSRLEMKNLIGNTVMQGMDQYRQYLHNSSRPNPKPIKPGDAT